MRLNYPHNEITHSTNKIVNITVSKNKIANDNNIQIINTYYYTNKN